MLTAAVRSLVLGALLSVSAATARAEFAVWVPYASQGPSHSLAMDVSKAMEASLGAKVEVVANLDPHYAAQEMSRRQPDGRTLLFADLSVALRLQRPETAVHLLEDFALVGLIGERLITLSTGSITPRVTNVRELVEQIHGDPRGAMAYAGTDSLSAHCAATLGRRMQLRPERVVSYPGIAPLVFAAGKSPGIYFCMAGAMASGQGATIVAVNRRGLPGLPQVPTFRELGFDLDTGSFIALFVRKDTPAVELQTLQKALDAALSDPALLQRLRQRYWVEPEPARGVR
jgi:tripartite-type tricarboxylate transporter receptor subunit TctC